MVKNTLKSKSGWLLSLVHPWKIIYLIWKVGSFQTYIGIRKSNLLHIVLREMSNQPSLVKTMFWNNIKARELNQPVLIVSRQMLAEMLRTILQNCFLLHSSSIQKVTDTQQVVKHCQLSQILSFQIWNSFAKMVFWDALGLQQSKG